MEVQEGLKVPRLCYTVNPGLPEMTSMAVYKGEAKLRDGVDYSLTSGCLRLLFRASSGDSGLYAIVAGNCLGHSNASFVLDVASPASISSCI